MGFFNELERSKRTELRIGFGTENKNGFTVEPDYEDL